VTQHAKGERAVKGVVRQVDVGHVSDEELDVQLPSPRQGDLVVEGESLTSPGDLGSVRRSDAEDLVFLDGQSQEMLAYTSAVVRDELGRQVRIAVPGDRCIGRPGARSIKHNAPF
jgi:hypothetical protein